MQLAYQLSNLSDMSCGSRNSHCAEDAGTNTPFEMESASDFLPRDVFGGQDQVFAHVGMDLCCVLSAPPPPQWSYQHSVGSICGSTPAVLH